MDFTVTPVILFRKNQQPESWSVGCLQTLGMAKRIQREPFAYAARRLAHVTQQKLGAQFLSRSPTLQPK